MKNNLEEVYVLNKISKINYFNQSFNCNFFCYTIFVHPRLFFLSDS